MGMKSVVMYDSSYCDVSYINEIILLWRASFLWSKKGVMGQSDIDG